jgi:hypothetical protein
VITFFLFSILLSQCARDRVVFFVIAHSFYYSFFFVSFFNRTINSINSYSGVLSPSADRVNFIQKKELTVYDYPMYIISDVEDNQVYLTINMVVHQTSFHLLG